MPILLGGPSILGALKILMLTDSARSILLCLSMFVFSGLAEDEYSIEVSAARESQHITLMMVPAGPLTSPDLI